MLVDLKVPQHNYAKEEIENPRESVKYTESGTCGRQTDVGASWDVDEYITGTNIALLRHKVLERRPKQLCSEAGNYSNLQ